MTTDFQPYVGPRPFEREDAEQGRFFGRDREASDLLSRVIAHPAVLFYSQSGAGKTSLLNAKLIPMLEAEGFETLKPARVRGLRPKEIQREEIQNIYAFNVLRSWDDNQTPPQSLTKLSISDYLKESERPDREDEEPHPRVAVFDQFEELFTFYPERWEDRQAFFEQVGEALEKNRLMRVVFVMREDYIAELDPYQHLLPEKLRTRYRLERLNKTEALQAVVEPLRETEYSFAPKVAEQLVNDLLMVPVETAAGVTKAKSEYVEPVYLQVVCQTLWEKCQAAWQENPAAPKVITKEHLEAFGDVDQALAAFYENAIRKVIEETDVKEGRLRAWFENTLITSAGTRGAVHRGKEEAGGIPVAVVDKLVNQHLIGGEVRGGGARWYELTHDRLIEPIKASNEHWRLLHAGGEQTRKLLEAKASQWARSGRSSEYLFDEGELLEARRWLDTPTAADVGYSDALFALVQSSRAAVEEVARQREQALAEEQTRRAQAERAKAAEQQHRIEEQAKSARRLRWLAAALGVMFFFSLAATLWAMRQQKVAVANETKAAMKEKEATENALKAAAAQRLAEDRTEEFKQQKKLAEESAKKLQEESARARMEQEKAIAEAANAKKAQAAERVAKLAQVREKEAAEGLSVTLYAYAQIRSYEKSAMVYQRDRKYSEALQIYELLLPIYSRLQDKTSEVNTLREMANIYQAQGNTNEAEKIRAKIESLPKPIAEVIRKAIKDEGVQYAADLFHDLRSNHASKYDFDEDDVNALGYELLKVGKVTEAIEVFKMNVEAHPQAYNTYDSLGEAYMKAGKKEQAIFNYEKSLKLNSKNDNARQMLKKLKTGS
jgi:tetratricopeptide (TPR) repeat protein